MADTIKDGNEPMAENTQPSGQEAQASLDEVADNRQVVNALEEIKAEQAIEAENGGSTVKHIGYWRLIARRFFRQPRAIIGVTVFVLLILLALFGNKIARYAYDDPDFAALASPPSADHWLGTDSTGVDMFAALCHGLGRSLTIGVLSALATTAVNVYF